MEQAGVHAARRGRHRRHARPGPDRLAARRRDLRQGARAGARKAADRRESPGRPRPRRALEAHAAGRAAAACRPFASSFPAATRFFTTWSRIARTAPCDSSYAASAARAMTPPAKPTTKWRGCSRSAIPADRSLTGLRRTATPQAIRFGEPKMKGNPYDFSFSGIKTAVLYHLRRNPQLQPEIEARQQALARGERSADASACALDSRDTSIWSRAFSARSWTTSSRARSPLRSSTPCARFSFPAAWRRIANFAAHSKPKQRVGASRFTFPSRALSTDNAAMIAAAGYARFRAGEREDATLNAEASLPLA